jgi:DNA polymerase-3 subunit delta
VTALKAHEVEPFLKRPDSDAGAFLVYGPDAGLVREVGSRLIRHCAGAAAGSADIVVLDGGDLDADPGSLVVEARTNSLFADRRVIRVRSAGKGIVPTLAELLDDPASAAIVLETGNLAPRDPLRALIEGHKRGRALPCYPDSDETLLRLIGEFFVEAGIRAELDVAPALLDTLGNDREVTRRELEKLALFAAESRTLTRHDVLSLCADNAALVIDEILDSAGTGHVQRLEAALVRAIAAAISPQQLNTMAIGHFTMLRRWRTEVDGGRSAREVMSGLRPQPHFSRRAALEQQLRLWSDEALAAALERLQLASADSRKRYELQATLVRRALLGITRMAAEH